ncbi:MAG: hypothetical protein Q8P67_16035 [archaeon]|nr:hypothetical protein [archaeon]
MKRSWLGEFGTKRAVIGRRRNFVVGPIENPDEDSSTEGITENQRQQIQHSCSPSLFFLFLLEKDGSIWFI